MEMRIRKIISLAAFKSLSESGGGLNALILGAFGCGVFKNDPKSVALKFKEVLIDEKLMNYFDCVIFPIYKDKENMLKIFKTILERS